jgi:hypothetical protein
MIPYEDDGMTDQQISRDDGSSGNSSWYSTTQQATTPTSTLTPSPTATTEPVVVNAPTATVDIWGGKTPTTTTTYPWDIPNPNAATNNTTYGGYTTSQVQGMTDAERSSLYDQIKGSYQLLDNDSGIAGSGMSDAVKSVWEYLRLLSQASPSIKQAALMPEYLTPGDKSGNKTMMDLLGLSQFYNADGGTGEVAAATSGTAGGSTSTGTSGSATTASGGSSSGTTSISGGGSSVDRLIDLAAAMYAGAGVKGGGTGFGGLVSGPIGETNTGELATPAASPSHKGLIIVVLILSGLAFWWYKKHKKGA